MAVRTAIRLRSAESADREAIQALWSEAELARAAEDEWRALIDSPTNVVIVADDAGAIAGAAVASFDGWRAYIYHVCVGENYRRQGLGHELMMEAEQYLMGAGARHVYVTVNEANTEGLALVGSAGYLPEGEIVLAKRLASRVG
jgi:ribosomal protein S18 acetylase RimI-like enzyme